MCGAKLKFLIICGVFWSGLGGQNVRADLDLPSIQDTEAFDQAALSIMDGNAQDKVVELLDTVRPLTDFLSEELVDRLEGLSESEDIRIRQAAFRVLGAVRKETVLPEIKIRDRVCKKIFKELGRNSEMIEVMPDLYRNAIRNIAILFLLKTEEKCTSRNEYFNEVKSALFLGEKNSKFSIVRELARSLKDQNAFQRFDQVDIDTHYSRYFLQEIVRFYLNRNLTSEERISATNQYLHLKNEMGKIFSEFLQELGDIREQKIHYEALSEEEKKHVKPIENDEISKRLRLSGGNGSNLNTYAQSLYLHSLFEKEPALSSVSLKKLNSTVATTQTYLSYIERNLISPFRLAVASQKFSKKEDGTYRSFPLLSGYHLIDLMTEPLAGGFKYQGIKYSYTRDEHIQSRTPVSATVFSFFIKRGSLSEPEYPMFMSYFLTFFKRFRDDRLAYANITRSSSRFHVLDVAESGVHYLLPNLLTVLPAAEKIISTNTVSSNVSHWRNDLLETILSLYSSNEAWFNLHPELNNYQNQREYFSMNLLAGLILADYVK